MARDRAARTRRQFVQSSLALTGLSLLSSGCGVPFGLWAQPARLPRIGYLPGGTGQEGADAFRQALEEHGYVVGRTATLEWRDIEGRVERYADLAAELVRLTVDVLVADGTSAVRAAIRATSVIPIVMVQSTSPVEDGFIVSLARPGGNVTGLTGSSRELIGKRLELLRAAVPGVSRVGVLWNPGIAERSGEFAIAEVAAGTLSLGLRSLEARDPVTLESDMERALPERVEALYLLDNVVLTSNPARVGAFALLHRLPMMSGSRSFVVAGGLVAYGINRPALYRQAATYVDKILKGAKPADLPVDRPAKLDLVLNLKTAQALGLTIPQSVLQQATEILQ